MNASLFLVGLSKLLIGLLVGAIAIGLAYRGVARLLRSTSTPAHNPAAGVLHASALVSLALLGRHSLTAVYDTIDLALHKGAVGAVSLLTVVALGVLHVGLALLLGTALLAISVTLFNRLTPHVDEVAAVREGHLAPALILGGILIGLALVSAPGLEAALAALVPFPSLPADTSIAP